MGKKGHKCVKECHNNYHCPANSVRKHDRNATTLSMIASVIMTTKNSGTSASRSATSTNAPTTHTRATTTVSTALQSASAITATKRLATSASLLLCPRSALARTATTTKERAFAFSTKKI